MCVSFTGVRLIKANGGEVTIQIQRGDARATLQSQSSLSQSQEEGVQWERFNVCNKCYRFGHRKNEKNWLNNGVRSIKFKQKSVAICFVIR